MIKTCKPFECKTLKYNQVKEFQVFLALQNFKSSSEYFSSNIIIESDYVTNQCSLIRTIAGQLLPCHGQGD